MGLPICGFVSFCVVRWNGGLPNLVFLSVLLQASLVESLWLVPWVSWEEAVVPPYMTETTLLGPLQVAHPALKPLSTHRYVLKIYLWGRYLPLLKERKIKICVTKWNVNNGCSLFMICRPSMTPLTFTKGLYCSPSGLHNAVWCPKCCVIRYLVGLFLGTSILLSWVPWRCHFLCSL